jgi:nucleoid-associated protein YgaU
MLLEKYDEAETLARQSIEELKAAKLLTVKYTVRRRDSLWKIAKMKKHYGRGSMWPVIWRANEKKIPDFDVLRTRLVLVIPKSESEIKKFSIHKKI